MDRGVWYDRDWMLSTVTRPARNAHGPLKLKHLNAASTDSSYNHGRVKYFIRKIEMIEFEYTVPTSGAVMRRHKMKYFYKKAPNPR